MKEETISNIGEFHELANTYSDCHPMFRGISDATYELLPRIGRSIKFNKKIATRSNQPEFEIHIENEKITLESFKRKSIPYINNLPENEWEWMAVAQHHGLPTRMMDWTSSPLVAAYFACADLKSLKDAAIYVTDKTYVRPLNEISTSPFDITSPTLYSPKHINPRIAAQSGMFLVYPEPEKTIELNNFSKWTIKSECKVAIHIMADRYGINHHTMFPDLDGLAKHISTQHGLHV